jgi:predicted permease
MGWWARLIGGKKLDEGLDAELRDHIERHVAECIRSGMSEADARRSARLTFGGLDQVKENCRDVRGTRWVADSGQDVKFACRVLVKNHWFTLASIITLGLCIGSHVAVFSIVESVLLRPLPVPDAERIVYLVDAYPGSFPGGGEGRVGTSPAHYFDRLTAVDTLTDQALVQPRACNVGEAGRTQHLQALAVTPSFFRLFGVPSQLGRVFREEENEIGHEHKVILSHALWVQLLGADPNAVGRDLRIDGQQFEIIGVMPAGFENTHRPAGVAADTTQLWIPLALSQQQKDARHGGPESWMFARLQNGATLDQVRAQVDAVNERNLERFPFFASFLADARFHTIVTPFQEDLIRDLRGVLYLLWSAVAFVLVIGTVNVANLALLRASIRAREFGVRLALGASRWRLARQLLVETLLLTGCAAALGLAIGASALSLVGGLDVDQLPRAREIDMNVTVVAVTVLVAFLIGIVVAFAPLAGLPTKDVQTILRQLGRSGTIGETTGRVQRTLVVIQVAVAFVLVTGAVLLLTSFQRLLAVDTGYDTQRLLTATVNLPIARYPNASARQQFAERLEERLRNLPGVNAVGLTDGLPFGTCCRTVVISPEGFVSSAGKAGIAPNRVAVNVGYFQAMRIPLLEGRFFDRTDTATSRSVVIVDSTLARRFWPNESPLGKRVYYGVEVTQGTQFFTVVGLVESHVMQRLDGAVSAAGAWFVPYAQSQLPIERLSLAIRTNVNPFAVLDELRREVSTVDPEISLFDVMTMDERISHHLTPRRIPMLLSIAFGVLALFLSALGTHSVLAYRVAQRSREFGIRMALGSTARQIFARVLSEGLGLLGVGLVLGLGGALALSTAIETQLYRTEPVDPILLMGAVMILATVAIAAASGSAWRAARTDPIVVLNDE